MPLQETSGAASYDAFGGGAAVQPVYIEQIFSTYLYTGNSSTQTITNGIDLAGEGGLVWIKSRSAGGYNNTLYDTVRGATNRLVSNDADVQNTSATSLTSFSSTGFSLGSFILSNESAQTYASWTFRKQPKFFDVVTYTGDGTSNRAISHNLGSVPGCILLKRTDSAASWFVYHRATGGTPQDNILQLNTTDALATSSGYWGTTPFTDTQFRVSGFGGFNASGGTYVAYLFAHNAGGFGLTGTDNVISCGTFTTDADGFATVNLGYEPQLVMIKRTDSTGNWIIFDNMRGWSTDQAQLNPNSSGAEGVGGPLQIIQSTGFATKAFSFSGNSSNIYIAIRRGPMKVPTSGTQVYNAIARTGTNTNATISGVGFSPDLVLGMTRSTSNQSGFVDRLRGINPTAFLRATQTSSEISLTAANDLGVTSLTMDGVTLDGDQGYGYINFSSRTFSTHFFRRAPGFFDEVCFTGPASGSTTQSHNLAAVPELIIAKCRSVGSYWYVYTATAGINKWLALNLSDAETTSSNFWVTAPTSTAFTCSITATGFSGGNVAYLFATVAGVSKVGSYTGTGTTQVINCGFTAGARFVLVKRTDSTGDWYVWDSARGIVAGNDPYLLLNSTAAEVTSTDYVDTASTGFEISSTAPAAINANGGNFIFFAVA
jgi:hypothetical protein